MKTNTLLNKSNQVKAYQYGVVLLGRSRRELKEIQKKMIDPVKRMAVEINEEKTKFIEIREGQQQSKFPNIYVYRSKR